MRTESKVLPYFLIVVCKSRSAFCGCRPHVAIFENFHTRSFFILPPACLHQSTAREARAWTWKSAPQPQPSTLYTEAGLYTSTIYPSSWKKDVYSNHPKFSYRNPCTSKAMISSTLRCIAGAALPGCIVAYQQLCKIIGGLCWVFRLSKADPHDPHLTPMYVTHLCAEHKPKYVAKKLQPLGRSLHLDPNASAHEPELACVHVCMLHPETPKTFTGLQGAFVWDVGAYMYLSNDFELAWHEL